MWRLATPPGCRSPTLFEQWYGFFYVPRESNKCKCCETEAGCSSLPEKTTKSNHLQMSLQGQHFLHSYFKTLSVGPAGVWTRDLAPAQQIDTLPTELTRRLFTRRITWGFIHVCTLLLIFLIPVEAGVCPNEENKKWKIENCDECYCRNTIVYCPISCV